MKKKFFVKLLMTLPLGLHLFVLLLYFFHFVFLRFSFSQQKGSIYSQEFIYAHVFMRKKDTLMQMNGKEKGGGKRAKKTHNMQIIFTATAACLPYCCCSVSQILFVPFVAVSWHTCVCDKFRYTWIYAYTQIWFT